MPAGIPVATVAVGGARNAGLLASAFSPRRPDLRHRMTLFQDQLAATAEPKARPPRPAPTHLALSRPRQQQVGPAVREVVEQLALASDEAAFVQGTSSTSTAAAPVSDPVINA